MAKTSSLVHLFFERIALRYPLMVFLCVILAVVFLGFQSKKFRLDASAETLVLDDDKDLKYSRVINSRYGENDFLIVTYTPQSNLLSDISLAALTSLRDDLQSLKSVSHVLSILNVPLLESPPVSIEQLTSNLPSLESPTADKELAIIELSQGPLYSNMLVSSNQHTTVLLVYFHEDDIYRNLLQQRNDLRQKHLAGSLTPLEQAEFKRVAAEFRQHRDQMRKRRHQDIISIRAVMDNYRSDAELFLGGVGMIADDMITFIKNDLKMFGFGILLFLIVTLGIIFRRLRWIFLPMLCCVVSAICMIGLLGWFGWEVTVMSSNFISLQLIMTMAISIHLIVRYRELLAQNPQMPDSVLILETIRLKLKPCVYAILTTIAGFASLLFCDILPVITFGWMMIAGLIVSLIVTFLLFPTVLILMPRDKPASQKQKRFSLMSAIAGFTENHGLLIMSISSIVLIASLVGISKLEVENCFIDYFKESTQIHQGMKIIDQQLGGTTPLDVIIDFEKPDAVENNDTPLATESDETFDEFDEFDELDEAAADEKYWFTSDKMDRIKTVHEYLENLPETGKVLSLATMLTIAERLNSGKNLDSLELALLYSKTPDKFKTMLVSPYVSVEHNQARFSIRVRDSEKSLRRNELLKKIKADLTEILKIDEQYVHLTGLLVLYNNMLQSLFSSQILTLGLTVLVLSGMFLVLFRSLKITVIAMITNVLPITAVLGIMGWLKMPLDMMTITIAAIGIGIAVDDTIHYIHRFREEFQKDRKYTDTMHRCHESIGHAMYYTSVTIIIGFSILGLSNFIPIVNFGLLTGLAMLIALLTALTLLPQLLIMVKPFGKES